MSQITTQQLKVERANDIEKAIEDKDAKMLVYFASLESKEGNDEMALSLFQLARRYEREHVY